MTENTQIESLDPENVADLVQRAQFNSIFFKLQGAVERILLRKALDDNEPLKGARWEIYNKIVDRIMIDFHQAKAEVEKANPLDTLCLDDFAMVTEILIQRIVSEAEE